LIVTIVQHPSNKTKVLKTEKRRDYLARSRGGVGYVSMWQTPKRYCADPESKGKGDAVVAYSGNGEKMRGRGEF